MKKLFNSKKALSPVVASIILIAVTVAVSIAVAAWMGALTFTFMATEEIAFTDCTYQSSLATATLRVKNTGTGILTIDHVLLNNQRSSINSTALAVKLNPGATATIVVESNDYDTAAGIPSGLFVQGNNYAFTVVTTKNNQFGPYTKTAPS